MYQRNDERTRETMQERAAAFVASQAKPRYRNAAAAIGIGEGQLRMWLHVPARGMVPADARKLAAFFGVPLECVVFKLEPIGPIVRRLRVLVCPPDRKVA